MKHYIFTLIILLFFVDLSAQNPDQDTDRFYAEMGYQSGIGDFASDYYNVQLTYGSHKSSLLFYGIGSSFRINQINDSKILGAFINTKSRLVPSYKPLLVDIGIGYNFDVNKDINEGGVLFFAGLHNEIPISEDFYFHCEISYDVMRIQRFGDHLLYRSYNAKIGLSF